LARCSVEGKLLQAVCIYGDVLTENTAMLQMCEELGLRAQDMGPEMRRVVLDLKSQGP
jgi:hypothetical protein